MARDVLTADRSYYVRSDALYADAPGRRDTAAGACQTFQQAVTLVAALDLGGHTVTIQHGSEVGVKTFAESITIPTMTGGGNIIINGSSTPGNTVIDTASLSASCFTLSNTNTPVRFQNVTLVGGGGTGLGLIQANEFSTAIIGVGVRFGTAVYAHVWVHDNSSKAYLLAVAYSIVGSAQYHIFVNMGGAFLEDCTVTLTGTPNFSGGFAAAINGGAIQSPLSRLTTFVGAATGKRYDANANGTINTFGGGATYFPGNAVGTTADGGVYV